MTETDTIEYTEEHGLIAELIGIIAWSGLEAVESRPPSEAADENGMIFEAHRGGVLIGLPSYLIRPGLDPGFETQRTESAAVLIDLIEATGGSHWTATDDSPIVDGIIQVADRDELEAVVVKARAWLSEDWGSDNRNDVPEGDPAPAVEWGSGKGE